MLPDEPRRLGPDDATIKVRTSRAGVAARAGHDLLLELTRWEATVSAAAIEFDADARSLAVKEGTGGVKPLTDRDRAEIAKTIDAKVLRGEAISFRSTALTADGDRVAVQGDLSLAGVVRPISFEVRATAGGGFAATVTVTQSEWGIKPYTAMLGTLKVADEVEVELGGD